MSEEKVGFITIGKVAKAKEIKELGVGMLGYAFMGKAHTNVFIKMLPKNRNPQKLGNDGIQPRAVKRARSLYK